jgi:Cap4, dsDNA endonuclease domain
MKKKMFQVPVISDPGSQAAVGFDYQTHVANGLCIRMLIDKSIQYVLCEFHEDVVQVRQDSKLEMIQVKKREGGKWSLNDLIKPARRQRLGILAKLFECVQNGKDISKLRLIGYGDVTNGDEYSLLGLIALLNTPPAARDEEWSSNLEAYCVYLATQLRPQGITAVTVEKCLKLLEIDFGLPHPKAIEEQQCRHLNEVVRKIWDVELSMDEVHEIYIALWKQVHELSLNPMGSWLEKSISREAALKLVNNYIKKYEPAKSRQDLRNTDEKLTVVGLVNKVSYALEKRYTSMYLRFEVGIDSVQWEDMRTEIAKRWQAQRAEKGLLRGVQMWQSMREVFKDLGGVWAGQDRRMGIEFVEGVFFDMTGTCDVDWRVCTNA